MATKIFPFGVGNALISSFKLILVAEGFTLDDQNDFGRLCQSLVEALLNTTPFNKTRVRPEWLTVIKVFSASANSGPGVGNIGARSTLLGSYVDTTTNRLVVDHVLLTRLLQTQVITTTAGTQPLSDFYTSGGIDYGVTGGLVAVITPAISSPAAGADDHVRPAAEDQYHLVATTANGLWYQVVLRGIAAALGLADEYELPSAAFAEASEDSSEILSAPNVVFSVNTPVMNSDFGRWRHVMSPVEWSTPALVHPHVANDLPDYELPVASSAAGRIEFWEGAAGYRRKAYRAAQDCLMRRAPGVGYLSARATPAFFCPVCSAHILSAIG